eukprot:CAMPEP_0118658108 /NCGR_PEP_ID=MMETSP0785-20121206/14385_1 /TAXON_ID=91992 /ORGANISM="Bolidomonas pacifica, Strain CCMP 1866" /LENGTH=93 /DNA_ID=CAMNT_0006551089 /DNA_START=507 /DNA_END=783 /DNA_ORIENTATION=+
MDILTCNGNCLLFNGWKTLGPSTMLSSPITSVLPLSSLPAYLPLTCGLTPIRLYALLFMAAAAVMTVVGGYGRSTAAVTGLDASLTAGEAIIT